MFVRHLRLYFVNFIFIYKNHMINEWMMRQSEFEFISSIFFCLDILFLRISFLMNKNRKYKKTFFHLRNHNHNHHQLTRIWSSFSPFFHCILRLSLFLESYQSQNIPQQENYRNLNPTNVQNFFSIVQRVFNMRKINIFW